MPETNKNIKSLRKGVKDTKKNGKDTITEIKNLVGWFNSRMEGIKDRISECKIEH